MSFVVPDDAVLVADGGLATELEARGNDVSGKPVIVYPNSGEEWDARRRAWAGRPEYSAAQPRQWIAAGAAIVGGCCRVRPADIAVIARAAAGAGQAPAS